MSSFINNPRRMSTFGMDSSMAKSRFNDDYDYLFTVLIIGDEAAGKSSLVQRYIEGTFTSTKGKPTIGIDFSLKYLITNGHKILLQLWDSSGQEKYRNLVKHFFTKMMGIIVVLDITSTKSLSALGGWIEEARKHAHPETQIILLGNKCDNVTKRIVTMEEMQQYTEQLNITYMECSCKENIRIDQVFEVMINLIMNKMKEVINLSRY